MQSQGRLGSKSSLNSLFRSATRSHPFGAAVHCCPPLLQLLFGTLCMPRIAEPCQLLPLPWLTRLTHYSWAVAPQAARSRGVLSRPEVHHSMHALLICKLLGSDACRGCILNAANTFSEALRSLDMSQTYVYQP
jgi:hypothetical protein